MVMVHHSAQAYSEASSDAAKEMRAKIETNIERGKVMGASVIRRIYSEVPEDTLVKREALELEPVVYGEVVENKTEAKLVKAPSTYFNVKFGNSKKTIHPFAFNQLLDHAEFPRLFAKKLTEKGKFGADLLTDTVNKLLKHNPDSESNLIRSVNGTVRGVLSSRYRRIDTRMVLEKFLEACNKVGALPYETQFTDTRVMLKCIMARVFEPIENEIVAFGVVFEDSEYGNGPTSISPFIERMWCTNKAVMFTKIRQIHVGEELAKGQNADVLDLDRRVVDAKTNLITEKVNVAIENQLGPGNVNALMDAIRAADEKELTGAKVESFLKERLLKTDAEKVLELYDTSVDKAELPGKFTAWRLSNALSFYANEQTNPENALELQKAAGDILATSSGYKG